MFGASAESIPDRLLAATIWNENAYVYTDLAWSQSCRGAKSLGRVVGVPSLWQRPAGGVLQQYGLGVLRQIDVSGLHERPGEASPNPF
jgi:hypothetical protein